MNGAFRAVLFSLTLAGAGFGQHPPLPEPLQLPRGLEQTLPISPSGSYYADAVKIQDCPEDKDNPLGLCNNILFGGLAMFVSQLSGSIHIQFFEPVDNIARFKITHPGGLRGEPVVQRAPILYQYPVNNVRFTDGERVTTGELDLTTGVARTLDYRVCAENSLMQAYRSLNPSLWGCELAMPGVYGTALGRFEQRADGRLDFTFFGSIFGPLGNNQSGKGDNKVRVPLPFCATPGACPGMEAPGTSIRPRLRISTREPDGSVCGANCPDLPFNSVQVFAASAYHSIMGDRFTHLNIPELGGGTVGWSHLLGRVNIQFGDRYGDLVPVAVWAVPPEGMLAVPPESPLVGFGVNMLGVDGNVRFPNYSYVARQRFLTNDPFDFAVGVVNVRTGKSLGDLVYRGLPYQDLFAVIQAINAGRIPADTFRFQGPASFERGPNGSIVFRFDSALFLDYSTFLWPLPDFNPAYAFRALQGSRLEPFLKMQATLGGAAATVQKSGEINERSSFGDQINIRYSIACDAPGKPFTFEYTNGANATRGGTFRMKALAAATCFNARGSTAGPGDADVVSFSGYGSWSKDNELHVATVQISTASAARYFIVQIDGALVSSADTVLTEETVP